VLNNSDAIFDQFADGSGSKVYVMRLLNINKSLHISAFWAKRSAALNWIYFN